MKEDFFKNNVKTMLKNKQPVSAAWIHSCSNVCTSIIASAGFDVAVIDMEHSPVDMSQLVSMIQATAGSDTVPFVRAHTEEVEAVIRDIEEKVLKSDKFLGTVASGAENAQKLYDRGYSYVVMMSDMVDLANYAKSMADIFKKRYRKELL